MLSFKLFSWLLSRSWACDPPHLLPPVRCAIDTLSQVLARINADIAASPSLTIRICDVTSNFGVEDEKIRPRWAVWTQIQKATGKSMLTDCSAMTTLATPQDRQPGWSPKRTGSFAETHMMWCEIWA